MADGKPLLEGRGISKYFGPVTALDGVNFQLSRGEVLGVIGDNGAGKSTMMKILSGLFVPSAGELIFDGTPVHFQSPRDARARAASRSFTRTSRSPGTCRSSRTSTSAASRAGKSSG
jgi:ABC-type sugar transport system ATPase subunit